MKSGLFLICIIGLLLTACGQTGPLYLPKKPQIQPIIPATTHQLMLDQKANKN